MNDLGDVGRRERKRLQQLDHLADTAWALFEAQGFEAVTMEAIAEAADVAKGTLYKHFPVKEALLSHRFHRDLRDGWPLLQEALAKLPPGRVRLEGFLREHVRYCESQCGYMRAYLRYRLAHSDLFDRARERSGLDRIFTELIAQAQAAGEFRSDIPAAQLAEHFQFAHLAATLRWLADDAASFTDEIARLLDLLINGMGAQR